MSRFIRYEYGVGVLLHRRLMIGHWLVILAVLFAGSAATPRLLQNLLTAEQQHVSAPNEERAPIAPAVQEVKPKDQPETALVDDELQSLIEQWVRRHPKQVWGVTVETLGNQPVTARVQADTKFYPASLYKLLLMQSIYEQVPYEQWAKRTIYDSRGTHTYLECIDLMLRLSDNPCGEAFGKAMSWKQVNSRLKGIGLVNTDLNTSLEKLHTTPNDMHLFLQLVHDDKIIRYGAKEQVFSSLLTQKFRDGIPAGSTGCKVYDKIGDYNGYKHDVGIVECGETTYLLTIMSKGGSYGQIAELARLINQYLLD